MCGIIGIINLTHNRPICRETLCRMLGSIRHRGPDQFGIYLFRDEQSGVGLGNARLSIIDLAGGQQPISNEDGTLWIVFNGEIFNYLELRPSLERRGHHFSTRSDTEVILHLYETYGPDCVQHLNGQFAFAIWDERARTVFMARDRAGIRPLYYTIQDGALIFASEMKAILAHERVTPVLDPLTLDQIFTYWSPLAPRTIFQGISTLPPGHWLMVDANGRIQTECYWQPTFPMTCDHSSMTIEGAANHLRHLLIDATRIRLRADVPVGAYLSGGLDSSTITALIRHYTNNRLETFSIAFTDEDFDESEFQQQMAAYLGTRHHLITCSHEEIGCAFPDVIWHTETPIMRTSPVPLYLLSRQVQTHNFKVVLTGEGADEFLGGYNIFKEAKIRRFWARQPDSAIRPYLLHKLYRYISKLGQDATLQKFFSYRLTDVEAWDYSHLIRWRNTGRSKRIFSPALNEEIRDWRLEIERGKSPITLPANFSNWSPLARAQYLEITIFMAEYLLSSQGDRVAMAHSIEGRFPFLDHRLMAFCNQLPAHFKLRGLDEKHILKRVMRDLLPETIWQRPKRPYRAPIHRSFFPHGRPLQWVAEMMSAHKLEAAGYFNPRAVAALNRKLTRLGTLSESDDMTLAGCLSTQLVHHHFIDTMRTPLPINENDDIKIVIRDWRLEIGREGQSPISNLQSPGDKP